MTATWRAMALLTAWAALATGAGAATLDFAELPPDEFGAAESFGEGQFQIRGRPASYSNPGAIHLDDSGSSYNDSVTFAGPRFDAVSVTLRGLGWGTFSQDYANDGPRVAVPYDNVIFTGLRDGAVVAAQSHSTYRLGVHDVAFAAGFRALDSLTITQVLPGPTIRAAWPDLDCVSPCAHIDVERIVLVPVDAPPMAEAPPSGEAPAAVPLPAGAATLLGALMALAALRRRARSAR